jgi:hypothetical protein
MQSNSVLIYRPIILSILLFIITLLLVKTLYKERNILTKKGMFFKSFCNS